MVDNSEPFNDTPEGASALQSLRQARQEARATRRAQTHPQHLQQSHNYSLLISGQTSFRRKNRDQQEQGTQEQGMEDTEQDGRGRSRQSLADALDKDDTGLARRASRASISLRMDDDLDDDEDEQGPRQGTQLALPVIDFSEFGFLLEGTASQGHNPDELVANDPGQFKTMVDVNQQVWFDVLSKIPGLIQERKEKRDVMNGRLATFKHENTRLRKERNDALLDLDHARRERDNARKDLSSGKDHGPSPAMIALQKEYSDFKALTMTEIGIREAELDEKDSEYEALERELEGLEAEHNQKLDALTAERDQAIHNLQQKQQQAESQTQPHADIFARPARRLNALRQPARELSRQRGAPSPNRQRERSPTHFSSAPTNASSSTKLNPRFPDPEIFKGDDVSKYRMWRSKMAAKLRSTYGGADADFRTVMDYIHSRTEGQTWQIIENHSSENSRLPWTTVEQCWEELDNNYAPRDEEAKAEIEFALCKQPTGESYTKWMISLRDLAARSGRELKANDVWMKLNDVYQKKAAQHRFKKFPEFDEFCIAEENAYDAMKAMRPKASGSGNNHNDAGGAGSGRGRGRGRGNAGDPADHNDNNNRTGGTRGEVVRYIPLKFKSLPKKTDPGETDRIFKNNLCFSCRQPGHSAGAKQCVFSTERGRYAFADVPREMTKDQYETFQRQRGSAINAMDDYENGNALPEPEQLRIENAPSQGNGTLRQ
jgi:hypothetical protein